MAIIEKKQQVRKITRSFRLRPDLIKKIERIASELGESKTHVLESLLDHAISEYEKEKRQDGD